MSESASLWLSFRELRGFIYKADTWFLHSSVVTSMWFHEYLRHEIFMKLFIRGKAAGDQMLVHDAASGKVAVWSCWIWGLNNPVICSMALCVWGSRVVLSVWIIPDGLKATLPFYVLSFLCLCIFKQIFPYIVFFFLNEH